MRRNIQYFPMLIALLCSCAAGSETWAQECACGPATETRSEGFGIVDALLRNLPFFDERELGYANNVAGCTDSFCGHTCRSEGIYFSAEMFFATVEQDDRDNLPSRLLELNEPAMPQIGSVDPITDPTGRFRFGYQTCDGLAVQSSVWDYDSAASSELQPVAADDPNLATHALDITSFDVEVAMHSMIDQLWDTTISGGYRFVEYEEHAALRLTNAMGSTTQASFDSFYLGNGLTGSLGARRQLGRRFSVGANLRGSLLFGYQTVDATNLAGVTQPPNSLRSGYDTRYILESQVGASYEHALCEGGYWFLRGGYEFQYWNDFVVPTGAQNEPSDTIFKGVFVAIGVQR